MLNSEILALQVESLPYFGVLLPLRRIFMYEYCRTLLLRKSCIEKISFLYSVSPECADVACISSRSSICIMLPIFTEEP